MTPELNDQAVLPQVSVCIPTYNGASYLGDAIASVLQQAYSDFEIVVVDNCSTDDTEALVAELSGLSDKIRYFRNDRNIGLAGNLNRCLDYARGQYIKYLCVDDLLLPSCLEQMAEALGADPAVSLVCGGRMSIDEAGQPYEVRRYPSRKRLVPGHEAIKKCLFGRNFIGEPTAVMFRKSDALTRFREDLPQLMDMEMWFRLLERGALLSITTPLCAIRFHNNQMTRENVKLGKLIDDNVLLFDEFSKKSYLKTTPLLRLQHKLMMSYRIWMSRQYLSDNKRKETIARYGNAYLYFLMPVLNWSLTMARRKRFRQIR
jgi:glycosyltransferase involved in cell wall biosynthesis